MGERLGLIAGSGKLPLIFAREARKKGATVIGFAIKDITLSEFDSSCDKTHRLGINEIPKFLILLLMERIKKIVLLGKVDKSMIYNELLRNDKNMAEISEKAKDKTDYEILDRITAEFQKRGVEVVSGLEYLGDLLPSKGLLTKRPVTREENEDIEYGRGAAKELARLDIGQTIIVKGKAVVSVEAMEGTDATIERAAKICGEDFSVIKVSRPKQDMRWDVPVVGPETVRRIAENGGRVLALEEKRMFLVEKETCVELADRNNISIVVV